MRKDQNSNQMFPKIISNELSARNSFYVGKCLGIETLDKIENVAAEESVSHDLSNSPLNFIN